MSEQARQCSRVIRVLGTLLVVLGAACGTEGTGDASSTTSVVPIDTEWSSFIGETVDGRSVVVAVDDRGGVLFSWDELSCASEDSRSENDDGSESTINTADPLDARGSMTDDGFVANAQMDYDGFDGDYSRYEVEVLGRRDGDRGMSGTVELTTTSVNGQGEDLDSGYEPARCTSEPVRWSATPDDPTVARTMWLFRDTARDDLDRFDELIAAGVALDARHPIRGTTLSDNVDAKCVDELSEADEGLSFDDGESSGSYPTRGAEETIDAMLSRGVPAPSCDDTAGD